MTFYGPVKFGPTGQINSLEPPVFQIQGGKPVVLSPAAIKQGEFKLGVELTPTALAGRANSRYAGGPGAVNALGAGLSLCLHRDRVLAGLGRAERHQPDPRLVHRARRLLRVGALSIGFGISPWYCAADRGAAVFRPRLSAFSASSSIA